MAQPHERPRYSGRVNDIRTSAADRPALVPIKSSVVVRITRVGTRSCPIAAALVADRPGEAFSKGKHLTDFSKLNLAAPLVRALAVEGYETPTPIQSEAIPHVLQGRDLLGLAATGTGKTAAFALPILNRLISDPMRPEARSARVVVLSPTRELTAQIADSFRSYGRNLRFKLAVIVGGVAIGPQTKALAGGLDILVATPGRLLDHLERGSVRLDATQVLVLDEADHMLDLGFLPAVRKLLRQMKNVQQNLLFSATMPKEIGRLAAEILRDPVKIEVTPQSTPAEKIAQRVIHVEPREKGEMLARLLSDQSQDRVLVFTRTKRGADKVVRALATSRIEAAAIHGNKSQNQRTRALASFRNGRTPVLVATDIAARGIDVDDIRLVVNYDLPHVPETYVHRIGRTARAGASGTAVSFCGAEERPLLRAIEKLTSRRIPV